MTSRTRYSREPSTYTLPFVSWLNTPRSSIHQGGLLGKEGKKRKKGKEGKKGAKDLQEHITVRLYARETNLDEKDSNFASVHFRIRERGPVSLALSVQQSVGERS